MEPTPGFSNPLIIRKKIISLNTQFSISDTTNSTASFLKSINGETDLLVVEDDRICVAEAKTELTEFVVNEKDRALFHEIRNYLDCTFTHAHSLKSISRRFGINEFKLKKVFRALFNNSVFNYLFSKRMEHALMLISKQRKPINEVAGIVGYKNSNHFSTAFKKKFGVVPSSVMN